MPRLRYLAHLRRDFVSRNKERYRSRASLKNGTTFGDARSLTVAVPRGFAPADEIGLRAQSEKRASMDGFAVPSGAPPSPRGAMKSG